MAGKLTPKDIAKYKEKSKRAINGLNIAIQKASEIAQTPKIGEKWKYIADCMGLKQEEGNSYYNTYIPLNSNVFFLLRNANHNNTIPELYNKREQNGRPNKRFVVFFQRDNKFGDVVSDFLESEHHTITYPPNALDTENDVIAYCKAYITLFQDGSTTFPKLPSIQENNTKTQYNMKQKIRLTEGDLHRIVRQCVNEALNELDARTYASYADKRQAQGQDYKAIQGRQAAVDAWNKDYRQNYQFGGDSPLSGDIISKRYERNMYLDDNGNYRINDDNYSKNVENGDTSFMKRTYNPHSNKISYNGERFDKLNNQVTKNQGEINTNPFDYDDRKVAYQMAQGNGNYVKGKGWQ